MTVRGMLFGVVLLTQVLMARGACDELKKGMLA
jgi:hypothetical protein